MDSDSNSTIQSSSRYLSSTVLLAAALLCICPGCAEGMFWRTGQYAPWVRDQWAAEEKIADTLFSRKRQLNDGVNSVKNSAIDQQEPVARQLTEIVNRDPVLLMRLHAVKLLGELNCPTSIQGLADASSDHVSDVRIEAVQAWGRLPGQVAVPRLQEIIGSDTDEDVRAAAIRAIGDFPGQQTVRALSMALDDRNPAIQLRATESLARVTGENKGKNVQAWQQYVNSVLGQDRTQESDPAEMVAELPSTGALSGSSSPSASARSNGAFRR